MKNRFAYILLLLLLSACFTKKKHTEEVQVTTPVITRKLQDTTVYRYLVSDNKIDTSRFELSYQYFIRPSTPWQDTLNFLAADFIYGTTHFDYDYRVKQNYGISDRFFIACLDSIYALALEDYRNSEYKTLWNYEGRTSFSDDHLKFATFSSGMYLFSGGAHGNTFYNHVNIEKESGRRLLLRDFISDTTEFYRIADSCFRRQNEIGPEKNFSDLGFWFPDDIFYCNDNFYLSDEGFHFIFNVYEIAPYAYGLFEFTVPFTVCRELIRYDLSR